MPADDADAGLVAGGLDAEDEGFVSHGLVPVRSRRAVSRGCGQPHHERVDVARLVVAAAEADGLEAEALVELLGAGVVDPAPPAAPRRTRRRWRPAAGRSAAGRRGRVPQWSRATAMVCTSADVAGRGEARVADDPAVGGPRRRRSGGSPPGRGRGPARTRTCPRDQASSGKSVVLQLQHAVDVPPAHLAQHGGRGVGHLRGDHLVVLGHLGVGPAQVERRAGGSSSSPAASRSAARAASAPADDVLGVARRVREGVRVEQRARADGGQARRPARRCRRAGRRRARRPGCGGRRSAPSRPPCGGRRWPRRTGPPGRPAGRVREAVQRAHAVHGDAERGAEGGGGHQADAQPGVRAGADADDDAGDGVELRARPRRAPGRRRAAAAPRAGARRPGWTRRGRPSPSCRATVTAGVAVSRASRSTRTAYGSAAPARPCRSAPAATATVRRTSMPSHGVQDELRLQDARATGAGRTRGRHGGKEQLRESWPGSPRRRWPRSASSPTRRRRTLPADRSPRPAPPAPARPPAAESGAEAEARARGRPAGRLRHRASGSCTRWRTDRVWLVDADGQVTADVPVAPGTVSPLPGPLPGRSRVGRGTGSDGAPIEHVVRFASVGRRGDRLQRGAGRLAAERPTRRRGPAASG